MTVRTRRRCISAIQTAIDQFADNRWRLNNLYYITDERGKKIPFRMNSAQMELFDRMHYLNIILKARQLGFTTVIQLYMLDAAMFNSNVRAGAIMHNLADAKSKFRDTIKFPYDNLPEGLKSANAATQDSADSLVFANNSGISVGTSMRGGTLQYLHVSEFGKICAKYPEKAREIVTGALNTIHAGQYAWIESTAEGQEGRFHDMCMEAMSQANRKAKLTPLDFKFFFFPWWEDSKYQLEDEVLLTAEDEAYFERLELEHAVKLTDGQKAWYAKKATQQAEDMLREFPSYPEEAFHASVEGAYYGRLMAKAEKEGRVCELPIEDVPTETWWDLGINDVMSIGWVQRVGPWLHFIDYYENSGEGLAHYANILTEKQQEHGLKYSKHLWPHDGNTRIMDETGRKRTDVMRDLEYEPEVVQRDTSVLNGIEAVRGVLSHCRFDSVRCERLVKALKSYRKEWDEDRATYKKTPLHNWASHPADMVRCGASKPETKRRKKPSRMAPELAIV